MAKCFSFTSTLNSWYRYSFTNAGLKSTTADLGDGTIMHCWVPKQVNSEKPNLVLLHGLGANAMWQWNNFISPLMQLNFNLYVPDLLFFGESYTSRPERSEAFQARCVMNLMESQQVKNKFSVAGISYGGFVAYSMAAQFSDKVDRLVLCCAGVCFEEKDMDDGMFQVKSLDEAVDVLLPQKPEKLRELINMSFYKPIAVPKCFLNDYIDVMCREYREERSELIHARHKGRNLSDLPKVTNPTLLIWGEHDKIYPPELAHRLKRHLGDNGELVFIQNAGHALNLEKPKEMLKHMKSFLVVKSSNPITTCSS